MGNACDGGICGGRGDDGRHVEEVPGSDWRHLFSEIDVDHKGFVSMDDLRKALVLKGIKKDAAGEIMKQLDMNGDNRISKKEFLERYPTMQHAHKATPANSSAAASCDISTMNTAQLKKHLASIGVPKSEFENLFKKDDLAALAAAKSKTTGTSHTTSQVDKAKQKADEAAAKKKADEAAATQKAVENAAAKKMKEASDKAHKEAAAREKKDADTKSAAKTSPSPPKAAPSAGGEMDVWTLFNGLLSARGLEVHDYQAKYWKGWKGVMVLTALLETVCPAQVSYDTVEKAQEAGQDDQLEKHIDQALTLLEEHVGVTRIIMPAQMSCLHQKYDKMSMTIFVGELSKKLAKHNGVTLVKPKKGK